MPTPNRFTDDMFPIRITARHSHGFTLPPSGHLAPVRDPAT
jgi:hypothetical protein